MRVPYVLTCSMTSCADSIIDVIDFWRMHVAYSELYNMHHDYQIGLTPF